MHSSRSNRDPQHVRSLIGKIDGGLDEARRKRLGPTTPQVPASPRSEPPARSEPTPTATPAAGTSAAPPIRSANEMFVDSGARLKARPKRQS